MTQKINTNETDQINSHLKKKNHSRPNTSKILFKNKYFYFILKNKVHLYKTKKNIDELE